MAQIGRVDVKTQTVIYWLQKKGTLHGEKKYILYTVSEHEMQL